MIAIIIISTLIAVSFSFGIWKAWKWFELRAFPWHWLLTDAAKVMAKQMSVMAIAFTKFGVDAIKAAEAIDRLNYSIKKEKG